jgi:hypothetical protein
MNVFTFDLQTVPYSIKRHNWYSWKFLIPTFFLLMTIFPYTRMSLKRKNCRAFGFFRHILVRTPSPTSTRPGTPSGYELQKKGNHKSLPISYRLLVMSKKEHKPTSGSAIFRTVSTDMRTAVIQLFYILVNSFHTCFTFPNVMHVAHAFFPSRYHVQFSLVLY